MRVLCRFWGEKMREKLWVHEKLLEGEDVWIGKKQLECGEGMGLKAGGGKGQPKGQWLCPAHDSWAQRLQK